MAKRPVFMTTEGTKEFVREEMVEFEWFPGFALSQKQKSIRSLHQAANEKGIKDILEISSKSESSLGQKLSAFNLKIKLPGGRISFVEAAFQSSKVFENGGPYTDLYKLQGREIKRDVRLKDSGNLTAFDYFGIIWDLEPKTAFYDWLYINALYDNRELIEQTINYSAFTDIVFNPKTSINCQARAAALFVSLYKQGLLNEDMLEKNTFISCFYEGNTDEFIDFQQLSF